MRALPGVAGAQTGDVAAFCAAREEANSAETKAESKAQKMIDPTASGFVYAAAGQSGYGLVDLRPGEYLAACYLPIGGTKKGEAHWAEGMYATLTVK